MRSILVAFAAALAFAPPGAASHSVSVVDPTPGEIVRGVTLFNTGSQASGVTRVEYVVNGVLGGYDDTCCTWGEDLDTTWSSLGFREGENTVVARSITSSHTATSAPVSFVVDNVPGTTPPPPPPPSSPSPPPPPPPPPPSTEACTKVLAAAGDLSSFLGTLRNGDVGCLRGGEYVDGCSVSWSTDASTRIRLRSYPGEKAIVHTSIGLAGDNLTAGPGLRITGIPFVCGSDMSGFTVRGANDVIEYNEVHDVTRHGILTHTSSSNTTVHGNYISTVGSECNLDHGVYFQRSGRITRNVFADTRCGYGIHLYSSPSNVVVAENTSVGSRVRAGILVNCSMNCWVVNNVLARNATHGITYRACSSGCVVDNNITWNNRSGSVGDSLASRATNTRNVDPRFVDSRFHVATTSPAADTGRADYAYFPDLDGVRAMVGTRPDVGAYEH